MDERAMLQQILESAEAVEIPDGLKPEAIEKQLREEQGNAAAARRYNKRGRRNWKHYALRGSRIAAVLALCICAGAVFAVADGRFGYKPDIGEQPANNAYYGGTENAADRTHPAVEEHKVVSLGGTYHLASNYGEVYDMLFAWNVMQQEENRYYENEFGIINGGYKDVQDGMEVAAPEVSEDEFSGTSGDSDYSATNVQTEGVDESDIVKTDGDFIYTLRDNKVIITDIRNNALTEIGAIAPTRKSASDIVREMYIDGNRLLLIMERNIGELNASGEPENSGIARSGRFEADVFYMDSDYETSILTYDISDRSNVKLLGEMLQDGEYHSSRKIGDKVYLFTDYYMDYEGVMKQDALAENSLSDWLPTVAGEVISADCIYLPRYGQNGLFMASMDINKPEQAIDSKLIVNRYGEIYVSADAVYLYSSEYNNRETTNIAKFELQDNGIIHAVNASSVNGCITDTFAIHEADGYLRVLTTEWKADVGDTNHLTILGKDMEYVSSIENIAPGERIYAARFFDDIGYFVTYRNTDPLFTVDLSDPYAPEIIGELKVTGFSEYLHRWDESHLIGIGYETDPDSGERLGVKLSMFDISDPANVTEEARMVKYGEDDSSAMWNYKSVLISEDKNVIAFATTDYESRGAVTYRVFSYTNGVFEEELVVPQEESVAVYGALNDMRSLYSGDTLYLVVPDAITAYDMENGYTEID